MDLRSRRSGQRARRGLAVIEDAFQFVAGLSIVAIMLLVSGDAFARFFLASPIQGTLETVERLLMIFLLWWSVAKTHRIGRHVNVPYIQNKLPHRVACSVKAFLALAAASVWASVAFTSFTLGYDRLGFTNTNTLVPTPLGLGNVILALGAALLTVRLAMEASDSFGQSRRGPGNQELDPGSV